MLTDNEVYALVKSTLLYFEYRQLQGFELLLKNKPISGIIASNIIDDYFYVPYNLRIQLLWACQEKKKEITETAIIDLLNDKRIESYTNSYIEILKKIGINPDKSNT